MHRIDYPILFRPTSLLFQKLLGILLLTLFIPQVFACGMDDIIKIGVLSHRGDQLTEQAWQPTAEYLTEQLPEYYFEIKPLDFDEIMPTVESRHVDFILVNPGIYVNLEVVHRVSRLATMNNRRGDKPYNTFGGVIFTRSNHPTITSLQSLHKKSFMAVDPTSLGGFQMAWREFYAQKINPYNHFSSLQFGGIHDDVVKSVINGKVDAGTVRTDILERMIISGEVDRNKFRILNPQTDPEFPFAHSTRLYPEWPFSKLKHTSNDLAQDVAIALLKMPKNHYATIRGNYYGWTIPLDYQPVHELFQELKLPPYSGKFTLSEVTKEYWYWVVIGTLALLFMIVTIIFVTQRNRYLKDEKAILEQRNKLILDSVGDGIYGVDLNGKSTFINQAVEDITGWTVKDFMGKNQHDLLHHTRQDGSHHPRKECPVYLTFRDNEARFIADDIFWKKDGTSFAVEYSSTPIRNDKGKTIGSVVVFRDITERKLAEAKRQAHQEQLSHVARLSTLGEIASSIAHELNQPLTAISTNARACVRLLESGKPPIERCADVVERIASQSEKAGEIIRHIRHFAHKESPSRQVTKIHDIIHTVLELLKNEIHKSDIKVNVEIVPSVEYLLAQEIQIEQVILNLIRNAIEAMSDNDKTSRDLIINVSQQTDKLAEIRITDTGPGLTSEIAEQVFDPFITTKTRGMGLGLSISYSIIENHESMLCVESTVEEGTSFYFTLPTVKNTKEE